MKALILTVTAGQGHHQCALAIAEYLKKRNIECEIIDTLKYINPILYESVKHGYLISTQDLPTAYGKVYRLAEKKGPAAKISPGRVTNVALSLKLKKLVKKFNPDVIICTHVFSAQIISAMHSNTAPTVGIITDFTFHPFWQDTSLDYYVTASEQLTNQASKKNIFENEILPFGIPIREEFMTKRDKQTARRELDIKDKPTVLVMSGSMGYGNMLKQIKKLDSLNIDFQLICVCGNNKGLYRSISKYKSRKLIYCYQYVNNIDVMMDASDVIITKPGGLTTSEALAKGLPLILANPIPGQEDRNAEFLLNNGAAMKTSSTFPIDECIYELFTSEWRLENMTKAAAMLAKPNSTKDLGDFIIENFSTELCYQMHSDIRE